MDAINAAALKPLKGACGPCPGVPSASSRHLHAGYVLEDRGCLLLNFPTRLLTALKDCEVESRRIPREQKVMLL